MASDDIAKYPAFSSIGSDVDWDRYSWIPVFVLDPEQTRETRDYTSYAYVRVVKGGWLDEDFKYKGEFFPKGIADIRGFWIPIREVEGVPIIEDPTAVIMYNDKKTQVPLECVFFEGREMKFDNGGLKGCLQVIPALEGGKVNPIGAGMYISEKVKKTLFTQLFLFSEEGEYFKLIYSDEGVNYFILRRGLREDVLGPIKIWEISYPDGLEVPEHYYEDELPDPEVTSLEGMYVSVID